MSTRILSPTATHASPTSPARRRCLGTQACPLLPRLVRPALCDRCLLTVTTMAAAFPWRLLGRRSRWLVPHASWPPEADLGDVEGVVTYLVRKSSAVAIGIRALTGSLRRNHVCPRPGLAA